MLDGKVVVVTGGGQGIGREEALACAAAGARVVVDDLAGADETAAAVTAAGGEALALDLDVGDFDAAGRLVDATVEAFGGLDGVVNNAGVLRDRMVVNMSPDEFDLVVRVNLRGTFCMTRHAAAWWRRTGRRGAIVNTTSTSGILGNQGQSNYGAAKAGVAAFTVITALELARYGVRVNAIAPGARTRMTEGAFGDLTFPGGFDPLDPANVAPVAVWLLSDAAAEVSGQVLGIAGGLVELYEGWHVVAGRELPARWTPEALAEAVPELFGDRPTRALWRQSSVRRLIQAARAGGVRGGKQGGPRPPTLSPPRIGPRRGPRRVLGADQGGAVGAAGGDRRHPGQPAHRHRRGPVAGGAVAELPEGVGAPGPHGAVAEQRQAVVAAAADGGHPE
jgi:NAD(P)-dependent dehydrogenase (short-subunit alcohol dehydrogenase family)